MAQSPCPHRIVDDMGYAFCMGSIGGSVWHGVKGYRNAPRGIVNRLRGCFKTISARAPVLGGAFAVWGLCFSSFDCTFVHIRRKDGPFNAIAAGFCTGALLAARAGPAQMFKAGMFGGIFLALIEGLGMMLAKTMAGQQQQGPISPYSQVGPGRHVGSLDASDDQAIGAGTHIAGVSDGSWSMSDDDMNSSLFDPNTSASDLDFGFDDFGEQRAPLTYPGELDSPETSIRFS